MFDQQKYYNLQYNYKLHYFYGYSLKQKYFSSNDILSIFNLNKISCFIHNMLLYMNTVKPIFRSHVWDKEKVASLDRWDLLKDVQFI